MKNKTSIIEKFSNKTYFIVLSFLIFFKVLIFIIIKYIYNPFNFTGNDSEYYDAYARGDVDIAVNIWPVILRGLHNVGLYSRDGISLVLFILNLLLIPVLACKLANLSFRKDQKYYLFLFLLCSIYPSLYYFSFDIYRDLFMVTVFLISCIFAKQFILKTKLKKFIGLSVSIIMGLFLFELRPYLGFAFMISLLLCNIKFTKRRILTFFLLYLVVIFITNYLGFLEKITKYRQGFENLNANTSLGLDFSNPVLFLPNFILSTIYQLLGLYFVNFFSIILFIIESIPVILMMRYIIKNIRLANGFVRFLLIFFVLYSTVWLIGNDNLGTAVRLRFYNYLSVYICFFYLLNTKQSRKA